MKKLNSSEIIKILENNYSYNSIFEEDWENLSENSTLLSCGEIDKVLLTLNLGTITKVDSYGGSGKGDDYWVILYFEDHDVYLKLDAFYLSYTGVDFSDTTIKEVRPQQKLITVYN